jgi:hypothetical protein
VRRSTAEIRRAIQFELEERDRENLPRLCTQCGRRPLHAVMVDVLRWVAGDPGTAYEQTMRQRNQADVAKMPAAHGGGR